LLSPPTGKALFDAEEQNTESPGDSDQVSSPLDSSPGTESAKLQAESPDPVANDSANREPECEDVNSSAGDSEAKSFQSVSGSDENDAESTIPEGAELPSIGSALHAAGECKRCNFYLKGRCQNGKDCAFCHFPHDKRKHSRQEKRERRAALLGENVQELTGPLLAPGPVGQSRPAALSADATPWQPDPEISPAYSLLATGQSVPWAYEQGGLQQIITASPLSYAPLATNPSPAHTAASTPFPTPLPTPTAGGAPGMMFSTSPKNYNPVALEGETKAIDEASSLNEEEHKWSREDLLRLREGVLKLKSADKETGILPVCKAVVAAPGL